MSLPNIYIDFGKVEDYDYYFGKKCKEVEEMRETDSMMEKLGQAEAPYSNGCLYQITDSIYNISFFLSSMSEQLDHLRNGYYKEKLSDLERRIEDIENSLYQIGNALESANFPNKYLNN